MREEEERVAAAAAAAKRRESHLIAQTILNAHSSDCLSFESHR
jgi:hypothetical protein